MRASSRSRPTSGPPSQRHHADLLSVLARQYDVDRTEPQRQMALGMRIASLLAAVTLSAGVVLFFYRVWGLLTTPVQVAFLVAMPLILLAAVEVAARLEPTRYVASILAIIAAASFALDMNVVGVIFNMTPTPTIFMAWAAFALALAYGYGLKLLLAAGIGAAMGYVVAIVAAATGIDWTVALMRPEPLLAPRTVRRGAVVQPVRGTPRGIRLDLAAGGNRRAPAAAAVLVHVARAVQLPAAARERAARGVRHGRLHPPPGGRVWGITRRWTDVVNASTGFLVLFAYAKFFDWWWEALPRYLFFLVLGGLAVATMLVLARLRRQMKGGVA